MRNLTDWAAASLLPTSVAEEIVRMEPMVFKAFKHPMGKWGRSGGHFTKAEGQRSDERRLGDALKTMMEPRCRGRADSQAERGRRAPPCRHRAAAPRSLGREVHGTPCSLWQTTTLHCSCHHRCVMVPGTPSPWLWNRKGRKDVSIQHTNDDEDKKINMKIF
jgi:hypothetical protein